MQKMFTIKYMLLPKTTLIQSVVYNELGYNKNSVFREKKYIYNVWSNVNIVVIRKTLLNSSKTFANFLKFKIFFPSKT